MRAVLSTRVKSEVVLRLAADALLVNIALVGGLTLRYLWEVSVESLDIPASQALLEYAEAYFDTFWMLTSVALAVFAVLGFYTRGRHYSGRYKTLVVAHGVTVSYLLFSLIIFLLWDEISFPRGALLPAWALTLVFLIGARVWTTVWQAASRVERRLVLSKPADEPIRSILVIGGAGYIGSALLPKLLDRGYRVRLLDLLLYGFEPIRDVVDHPNLEVAQADFLQVDEVVEAMYDMDAVVHLGAIVGDPACNLDEKLTIEVNLMATRMIAEVAKCWSVKRFVFASTCSVYGAGDEMLDERSTLNPVSLYARSKVASEKALMNLADDRFTPVCLRFATIYGLSGRIRFDLVINLLAAKALVDGQITVLGGDQWRPFVHVDDAALAVVQALEAPRSVVRNEIFNVGANGQNYTIQQAAEIIHRLVPSAELIQMGMDGDRRNYRVDFGKIRRALNFDPQWTVEGGVWQVLSVIQGGLIQDYRDPKYSNVAFLRSEGLSRFEAHNNGRTYELLNETIARLAYDRPFYANEIQWPYELIAHANSIHAPTG